MLSRRSSFVPRRRYLVFGFLMLLSWCLLTLPHLWFAHRGARDLSDSPRERQTKADSVITSHGTTLSSSPAVSEAHNLPGHDEPAVTAHSAKQYAKETRGNSDTLSVDHDNSRTDDIPIKVNDNNEFDSERTNRNDDVRIQNSENDALAENHGSASDEIISSEGRGHDVANSGHDVPTNSRNGILVTGNSGLDLVSGDKNRKDFLNNEHARSDLTHTGYSDSQSLDHVHHGEQAHNQKTSDNDLVNNDNNRGDSVPNSNNEHVSDRMTARGAARDGNNEFADDGKNGDSSIKHENKDDDLVHLDVPGDTAFTDKENNRNIAFTDREDNRNIAFTDREDNRNIAFTDRENNRNIAFTDREDNRNIAFTDREDNRNIAFTDRENNRNIAVVKNEDDNEKIPRDTDDSGEDMLQAESHMKDDLFQAGSHMKDDLFQAGKHMKDDLFQAGSHMKDDLFQAGKHMKDDLFQAESHMKDDLFQTGSPMKDDLFQAGKHMKDDLFRKGNGGYEVLVGVRNSAKGIDRNWNSRNDVIVMDADDNNAVFHDKNNMFQVLQSHQDHNAPNGKAEEGHSDQSDTESNTNDGLVRNDRLGNHEDNRQDGLARGREDLVASNGGSRIMAGDLGEPAQSPGKLNVFLPGISRTRYNISVYDEVLGQFVPFSSSDSTQHTTHNGFPNGRQAADNYPIVQKYKEDNSQGGYGTMSDITDRDQHDSHHNSQGGYGTMSDIIDRDQHDSHHNRSIPQGLILKSFREISLVPKYDDDERQEYVARYTEKPAPGDTQINDTERFPWKPFKAEGVDCSKLFAGDESELRLARDIQPLAYNTTALTRDASNCSDFVARNGFITSPLTSMEREFPIAYSILVYKEPTQVVDLLRAIYRPQNYYCLHVDSDTRRADQDAFRAIAQCFHNVFLSSRSARVTWGQFGVLQAEVFCMEDLYQYPDWRYFINLTGQEFPLKTNYEIVRILIALRGANDVHVENTWKFMERWCRYLPAPHNLTIYKGSVHMAVSRPFVRYVVTSPVATDFLHWVRPIKIPDEVFFNTLNHNPHLGVPGSYNGPYVWRNLTHKPHLSRFKNWDHNKQWRCAGRKYVRNICILSAGDLPLLDARPELFANKFYSAYSHVARKCLAEKLYNRTRQETLGTLSFDVTYYEHLPFLRHIVRDPEL